MDFLAVAGVMSGNLCGFRPAESASRYGLFDLLAAWAGRFKVLGGVALYVGSAALARFDLVAEIAEPVGQLRLVDSGCKLLAIEVALRLNRASGAIPALGHIEDHGMGMELRGGIAVHWAGGVMLELCHDELAGSFGGMIAADASLRVTLQLRKGDGHGLPVGFADTVIAANKGGQRHRLGSRKGSVPSCPVLHRLDGSSVCGGVLLGLSVLDQLLGGMGILPLAQTSEVLAVNGSGEAVLLGQLSLPLSENAVALLPIVLLGGGEFLGVIGLGLAGANGL